ncbi:MAG: SDR family oxidoreductase [Pseudomonadota bacterium]
MPRLQGKRAVVTGAARGIGLAIAEAFLREGAHVVLTDIDEISGDAAASLHDHASFMRLDVTGEEDWERLFETHPAVDIVVNNAGITGFEDSATAPHDPENASLSDWRSVHAVNLDGVFLGCRYALRAMRKSGEGSIINVSSRSGLVGIPGAAAYASSKAAVRNHTKTVALYAAEQGWQVRCNSIHPAAILTPMWEPMLGDGPDREERMAAFTADTPLKRFGTVDEVAELALMLASDECRYMTGTELQVDGGLLAGSAARPDR